MKMVDSQLQTLVKLEGLLLRPVTLAGQAAAWCGFVLVLVVSGNVLARYVFNLGSVGMQELEWHLVSPIALIGMSYAMQKGEHVRVDFLYERMSEGGKQVIDLVSALLLAIVAIIIVLLSLPYIEQSYSLLEGSPDPGGLPYRFLLKAFIPLGFFLLTVQALSQIVHSICYFLRLRAESPGTT